MNNGEFLEILVDNDNSAPFETRVKRIIDRYFRGSGITSDDSYIDVIRDGCRKLSYFKPDDVSDKLKILCEGIPDYVKLYKFDEGYQIVYPMFSYTICKPDAIMRGVESIRRTVLSEAIKFYMALNKDKTDFIVDDSIPDGVLIGNRDSYINYMRNRGPW